MMEQEQQLRNLRDFLMVYNRMTETCFQRCTSNFNYRNLTMEEERCLDSCAGKLIRTNHRLMATYVQLMPKMVQRRMEELETKAAENAKAAEAAAAAAASTGTPAPEDAMTIQSPVTSPAPLQIPAPLPSAVTEVGPEAHNTIVKPAGINMDLNAFVPKSTTATDVTLSAATPMTPATEAVNILVHNKVESEPSHVAALPQLPINGAQIESASFQSGMVQPKPVSLIEDVTVPVVSAPTVSQQERAPEASGHQGLIATATTNKLKPDE